MQTPRTDIPAEGFFWLGQLVPARDALDTSLAIIDLLRSIPRKRFVTATQLAHSLTLAGHHRSKRSVQRLLEQLTDHFPIECDTRSKPFGYRWREGAEGFHLPVPTPAESILLCLAQAQLQALLPGSLDGVLRPLFSAARRTIENTPAEAPQRRWLEKVRRIPTTQPLLPPKILPGVLDTVSTALYLEHKLRIVYRNVQGEQIEAIVWPLGLALQEPRLYLVSRFEGYDNERILALVRIERAEMLDERFPYPEEFSLATYDAEGRFAFGEGRKVQVRFRIDKATGWHLLESPLSDDQSAEIEADAILIRATVTDSKLLHSWLRGFGKDVWDVEVCGLEVSA